MYRATLGEKAYRDYGGLLARIRTVPGRDATMQAAVDAFWDTLGQRGVSWIGFYLKSANSDEMLLGARRDKPACSPIGLHGMCGRCWKERRPILVSDVATLGAEYIACDPRDKSELVIPLFEPDGSCWGVLDADSYDVGAFSDADVYGLTRTVERLGLSTPQMPPPAALRL
jgi:putative methionine-R-sulfoxide reductase with GAF domain